MNTLSSIILGISSAAILIGSLFVLCPSGGMGRTLRYVFTLVFLGCCVSLFLKIGKVEFRFPEYETAVDNTVAAGMTAAQAEYICRAALIDQNISFSQINIFTDIDETGSIFIKRIEVVSRDNAEKIRQTINSTVVTKEVEVK